MLTNIRLEIFSKFSELILSEVSNIGIFPRENKSINNFLQIVDFPDFSIPVITLLSPAQSASISSEYL